MNTTQTEIAIIGAGTAGLAAAHTARALGARVTLVERARLGGRRLSGGLVPIQALSRSAKVFELTKRGDEFGIRLEKPRVVWAAVKLRVADIIDEVRALEKARLSQEVTYLAGTARFVNDHEIIVQSSKGEQSVRADYFIVATGSQGNANALATVAGALAPEELFNLASLPKSLVILGLNQGALELAQAMARLGTQVTVVSAQSQIITGIATEMAATLQTHLENEGVTFHLSTHLMAAGREDDQSWVEFGNGEGATRLSATHILSCEPREPRLGELQLANAGLDLACDAALRTRHQHILAAGSVLGLPYTEASAYQGALATRNALQNTDERADYALVPRIVFTDPQVAALGTGEAPAGALANIVKVSDLVRSHTDSESSGFCQLETDAVGKICAVRLLAPDAAQAIETFVFPLQDGLTRQQLAKRVQRNPASHITAQMLCRTP